ncbi:MAG: Planctomycete cytochrome [Planctomycetaceae bacterium]|nr:Planctomycete cytochrome [Planctomycetaceae bacterium]
MKRLGLLIAILLCVNIASAEDQIDYAKQIKPILQARCYACHGVLKQASGLRLDTAALAIKGGDSGEAIKPGNITDSPLLERISAKGESERMPPEGEPLKPEEIAAFKAWIAQGAKAPQDEKPERDPRDHWSFKTPVRPAVPAVQNSAWVKNPIDAFIAAEHQKRGLKPQPAASKHVWLRRVSLDLVGLPPTREQLDAFIADESAGAYDTVVTRLLDSPQYGERWGRHWMDIWRYSDWWGLGAEVRNSQKHIWHWRDWIIESINTDKGYDQMLREMLAADELYPNDLDRLRASGFLARQYFKFNRTTWLDETVEHTAKAMLGLTFNCAKCHDHKYDPFSHVEYHRMRAFFEPYQVRTDAIPGEIDFEKDGIPRAFDCNLGAQTFLLIRGDDRNPDKSRVIEPIVPAFLSLGDSKIEPVALPADAYQPGLRSFIVEAHLKAAQARIEAARIALAEAQKKLVEAEQAAKVAATKAEEAKPVADAKPLVRDDFAAAKPDLWEMREGMWSYANGKLIQSHPGPTRSALRLKQMPPADFEAKLKYIPTGGETWKSVGINFDVFEQNEVLAYLSSYAGGPKSQVAYKQAGNYVYPPGALQNRPIDIDKPHELIVRVRGPLVNVLVDGTHSIAYRLPVPRQAGHLELITYDAKAEFLAFELSALQPSVTLVDVDPATAKPAGVPLPIDQAKQAVVVAQFALATAESQPASIQARAAADRARHQKPMPENLAAMIATAVRAERVSAAAKSDEDVAAAELEFLKTAADKRAEVEKKVAAAKTAQDAARKAIDTPGETYTSLVGSLKTFESNLETEDSRRKPFPQTSTGRRSALAKWITDPRHPLPARVAVNHLWSRHFGRALVPTVFDFGRKGTPPTHPELVDWLAVEFIEHGWSMKHIHRLIVTSNTYRMTSSSAGVTPEMLALDPDNHFLWRTNPIRMEAQLVRDSLLHLAGELDLTRGGPPLSVDDETSRRRSLYFIHSHNEHQKFLAMFDDANVLECYRRSESIVPQQALALENSPLATVMAEKITQRMTAANANLSDHDFIRAAFLNVLCLEPTTAEQAAVVEALGRLTAAAKTKNRPNPELQARTNLIQALINHNDFVTVR